MRAFLASRLTWSQAIASATGMLPTVVAAAYFAPTAFGVLALFSLFQSVAIGFLRSLLLQPALIEQRQDPGYRASMSALIGVSGPLLLAFLGVCATVAPRFGLTEVLALGAATFGTFVHDWLRHRAIADDRLSRLVASDALRLALTLGVVLLAFPRANEAFALAASLSTAWPACVLLAPPRQRAANAKWRVIRSMAAWQSIELAIAQLQSTVPFWLVGTMAQTSDLGAFRLAQTWLGPINLLTMALSTNLLSDAARDPSLDVRRRSTEMGRWIAATAALITAALAVVAIGLAPQFSAVDPDQMIIALVCVGAATVGTGYSGMRLMAFRILRLQRRITPVRAVALAVIWGSYAAGFAVGGAFSSLVAGFAATALIYPVLVNLLARSAESEGHSK